MKVLFSCPHWGSADIPFEEFLARHKNPAEAEYYICGPPEMVSACIEMLKEHEIEEDHVSFDEF